MNDCVDVFVNACMDVRLDGWVINGCVDGSCMDNWMDGGVCECVC